jgi:tryptophan synthase alpha chain
MVSPSAITLSDDRRPDPWSSLHRAGRPALIPYLTAGHPDATTSLAALQAVDALADVVEVGVPFSDPLADGPVIQRASLRALQQGMTLAGALELIARARPTKPIVLFSYLNPVLRYGVPTLLRDAAALGVAGLLLTDLPLGADLEIEAAVEASPLDLIRLVAPTTSEARLARLAAESRGFLYLIARLGVTGRRDRLPEGLAASVARVRRATPLPIAVGFGISSPAQVRAVGEFADGVVIGSALVEALDQGGVDAMERLLSSCQTALAETAPAEAAHGR